MIEANSRQISIFVFVVSHSSSFLLKILFCAHTITVSVSALLYLLAFGQQTTALVSAVITSPLSCLKLREPPYPYAQTTGTASSLDSSQHWRNHHIRIRTLDSFSFSPEADIITAPVSIDVEVSLSCLKMTKPPICPYPLTSQLLFLLPKLIEVLHPYPQYIKAPPSCLQHNFRIPLRIFRAIYRKLPRDPCTRDVRISQSLCRPTSWKPPQDTRFATKRPPSQYSWRCASTHAIFFLRNPDSKKGIRKEERSVAFTNACANLCRVQETPVTEMHSFAFERAHRSPGWISTKLSPYWLSSAIVNV